MNAPSKKPQAAAETVEDVLNTLDAERKAVEEQRAANLRIWNAVCRTDPRHTKPVEFGRKFTAIDAHYQIQEATRMFGPVGEGWGYDTGEIVFADGLVIVPLTLWHGSREKAFGPIYGSTTLRDRKGNIDKDAPKKATTDALTKALSQLGFNADVFLGKFDDNKYVEQVRKEFEGQDESDLINDAQWEALEAAAEKVGADKIKLAAYLGVPSLRDLPVSRIPDAEAAIAVKAKAKAQKQKEPA